MHRFWGHLFDLMIITLETSNFELKPERQGILIYFYYSEKENKKVYIKTYKIKTKKLCIY
jgi:hypothetical protein